MRNAGRPMPSCRSSQSPNSAAPASTPTAIRHARRPTCRRAASGSPSVTPRNAGASPIGSTTTNSVTKAEITNSIGNDPMARLRADGSLRRGETLREQVGRLVLEFEVGDQPTAAVLFDRELEIHVVALAVEREIDHLAHRRAVFGVLHLL